MEENQELESISEEGQEPEAENTTEEQIEAETPAPRKPRNPNAKWYILQAYTGYETRVEQTIREKLKIQGIENWLKKSSFLPKTSFEPRVVRNERSTRNIFQDTF